MQCCPTSCHRSERDTTAPLTRRPRRQVVLGEYDVSTDEGSEQSRAIAEMVFSDLSSEAQSQPADAEGNDIALIRIDRPVLFSTYVKAIELPEVEEEFAGALGDGVALNGMFCAFCSCVGSALR